MAEYVFTLRNVRKAHGDKVVLDNVTLSFLPGAKIGVVGPNGAGKSTLLQDHGGPRQAQQRRGERSTPATRSASSMQEPPLDRGQDGPGERRRRRVAETKAKLGPLQRALRC